MQRRFRFKEAAVGGTFDVLHAGHERLLSRAFGLSRFVYVGVSGDALVPSLQKHHEVRPFSDRRRDLRRFLKAHGWHERSKIVQLKDPFGPAISERNIQALIVSRLTAKSGRKVNSIRHARKLPPLRLIVVKMVRAKDGKPISTTRIRRGEIDSRGALLQR
ncbi:MAG TPA: pantetheine-phosphate adenylyltransferase [Candidatus Bathyarchaeia archaeon]|nr:pantetheine-phosphate adenylyltransferase [Candidatus Bathyarchaeia archaeon]